MISTHHDKYDDGHGDDNDEDDNDDEDDKYTSW